MKNLLPILLAIALLFAACGGEPAEPSAEIPTEVTGSAAGETTQAAETTGPAADQSPEGVTDPPGDTVTVHLLTRMAQLDETGAVLWYREYTYNSLGQLTGEAEYGDTGVLSSRTVCTYNARGLCESRQIHQMDPLEPGVESCILTTRYSYDENGRVARQESWENDVLRGWDEFTYDHMGSRLTCQCYQDGSLVLDWSYICRYDEEGNLLSREELLGGQPVYTLEFSYDSSGRCTGSVTYTADGIVENRCVITWEGTTETSTCFDREDNPYLTTVTTYDGQGNITFRESLFSDGTVTMTEYTYEPFEIQP